MSVIATAFRRTSCHTLQGFQCYGPRHQIRFHFAWHRGFQKRPSLMVVAPVGRYSADLKMNSPALEPAQKQQVLVISGPTAVGKSALALELAQRLGGEIISCDSVQVFRGLDIGSAKTLESERRGIPHHLLDIKNPNEEYTAGDFCKDARAATEDVLARGKVPIVVGGTGLYLRWFIHGPPDTPKATPELVAEVESRIADLQRRPNGWPDAVAYLAGAGDPKTAAALAPNDWYRMRRAVEIVLASGKAKSEFQLNFVKAAHDAPVRRPKRRSTTRARPPGAPSDTSKGISGQDHDRTSFESNLETASGLDISSAQPDAAQSSSAQPSSAQPDTAQPDSPQPNSAQPDAAQPGFAQLDSAQPDSVQTSPLDTARDSVKTSAQLSESPLFETTVGLEAQTSGLTLQQTPTQTFQANSEVTALHPLESNTHEPLERESDQTAESNPQQSPELNLETPSTTGRDLDYDFRCYFLFGPRRDLYRKIDERCEQMLAGGLLEEGSALLDAGIRADTCMPSRAIGYRQALEFLEECREAKSGGIDARSRFLRLLEEIQQASRRYAKRQLTWFRSEGSFLWLDASQPTAELANRISTELGLESSALDSKKGLIPDSWLSREQEKELKAYRTERKIFNDDEAIDRVLTWVDKTQRSKQEDVDVSRPSEERVEALVGSRVRLS